MPQTIAIEALVRPLVAEAGKLYQELLHAEETARSSHVDPERSHNVGLAQARLNGACEILARMWQLMGMSSADMDVAVARRAVVAEYANPSASAAAEEQPVLQPSAETAADAGSDFDLPSGAGAVIAARVAALEPVKLSRDYWRVEIEERTFFVKEDRQLPAERRYVIWGPGFGELHPISREPSMPDALNAAVGHLLAWGHRQHSKVLRQAMWLQTAGFVGEEMAALATTPAE